MNNLELKATWNKILTKVKQIFADFVEGDMIFSEAREIELIKLLEKRIERAKTKTGL